MKYLILISFFATYLSCNSQQSFPVKDKNASSIVVSALGNVFIHSSTSVYKYSQTGELLAEFSVKNNGSIASIDVSNPFKILVFYKDFQNVIVLDSQLKNTGEQLSFEHLQLYSIEQICWANNNTLWLYDSEKKKLINISLKLEQVKESTPFSLLLPSDSSLISHVYFAEGFIYCEVSQIGVLVFDNMGTYLRTIYYQNTDKMQLSSQFFTLRKSKNDGSILMHKLKTNDENVIATVDIHTIDWYISNNMLFELKKDSVELHAISY